MRLFCLSLFIPICCWCLCPRIEATKDDRFSSRIVHDGWIACRNSKDALEHGCRNPLNVGRLPTTALAVLMDNEEIPGVENMRLRDIYNSTNLALLPDIHEVGRDFYTLLYELPIPSFLNNPSCREEANSTNCNKRQTLRFAGINYRVQAWLDGRPISPLEATPSVGLYIRRSYDVTPGGRFQILVEPPDHPGDPTGGGQGGKDHALAQDGAVPQYMLGWDWCQAMPDRATGFYGSTVLETSGINALLDPAIQTIALKTVSDLKTATLLRLRILARIESVPPAVVDDDTAPINLKIESDWGETWIIDGWQDPDNIQMEVTVRHPELVRLWWPNGVGMEVAHLHSFTFTVLVHGQVAEERTIQAGIRTIETHLDKKLQGQRFLVNGKAIYLVGGNWIGTDQAFRYSASKERYCAEIGLHKHAGLNLIRVWGGGTAERDDFYDCADSLGLLVMQEFWMTGDNNGRWAGNYSWPLDYDAYLANVEDTVKRLRGHASLLFYCGCNECLSPRKSQWAPNPPRYVDDGIRSLLQQFDPDRFFISSSMGGPNKGDHFFDPVQHLNRSYSLAYSDGPYHMLLPSEPFLPNPGKPFRNVSIGFQPEVGSASAPTYYGFLRFLTQQEVETGFPRRHAPEIAGSAWAYHNFGSWASPLPNNRSYDHVYAYFPETAPVAVSDWIAAAQLAAHSQYQNLFHGFVSFVFERTTAVVMWKTQSPWPALRGFLYDWYLESTGSLHGTRAALGSSVSVVLDLSSWRLRIVNRRVVPLVACPGGRIGAEYDWIDVHGSIVASRSVFLSQDRVAPMTATLLDDEGVSWPGNCTSVCFLRLRPTPGCRLPASWQWLTDPSLGDTPDFSLLGTLRERKAARLRLGPPLCALHGDRLRLEARLSVEASSADLLLYPTFSLWAGSAPVLPLLSHHQAENTVVLPGESKRMVLEAPATGRTAGEPLRIVVSSWNAPDAILDFACSDHGASLSAE